MFIKNKKLNIDSDLVKSESNTDLLIKWAGELNESIASMKLRLDSLKRAAHSDGVFADREYFHSLDAALRLQGVLKQQVQNRLSELKKTSEISVERAFVLIAKNRLSKDLYDSIKADAIDMSKNRLH